MNNPDNYLQQGPAPDLLSALRARPPQGSLPPATTSAPAAASGPKDTTDAAPTTKPIDERDSGTQEAHIDSPKNGPTPQEVQPEKKESLAEPSNTKPTSGAAEITDTAGPSDSVPLIADIDEGPVTQAPPDKSTITNH